MYMFGNDVKAYSIQTNQEKIVVNSVFENDAKMYSVQTVM